MPKSSWKVNEGLRAEPPEVAINLLPEISPLALIPPCTSNFWSEIFLVSSIVNFVWLNLLKCKWSLVCVPIIPPDTSLAIISTWAAPPSLENLPSLPYMSPLALISPEALIAPFTFNNTSDEPDITNVFVPAVCLKDTKSRYGKALVPNEILFPVKR